MSAEQNKANARRFFDEVWNQGNLDVIDQLADPNVVGHEPVSGETRGREALRQLVGMYRTAFPDLRFSIEDQFAEGDKVVTRFSSRGTHRGDLMGIAPTGRQTRGTGISIDRYSGGTLVEDYTEWDALGLMQQLGVIPELRQVAATRR